MRNYNKARNFRVFLPAMLGVSLMLAGLVAAGSSAAYSQRRSSRRAAPGRTQPQQISVYAQGYQKGYTDGFAQGPTDFRQRTPRDFQRSDAYQQREQRYDQRWASSQEYQNGYDLGFELGYSDGYYGRAWNAAVPANASLLVSARQPASVEPSIYAQGYQKGYGDGYAQGPSDSRQRAPRDFQRSNAFQQRYQQYDQRWASSQEYRDGYDLGLERGYDDGYDGRQRNATVPDRAGQPERERQDRRVPSVDVPNDTEMRLRLTSPINTRTNRVGDRFTATVMEPRQYEGATVDGHIYSLNQSGRVSGRTELLLAIDSITLADGRRGPLSAQVERVIESETVKTIDEEGRIETGSRTRDSEVRGGVGAGAGAVIGGIVGGGKGALIGALIGGTAGVGTVYVEGNKHLIMDPGTELFIRVARSQRAQ